MYRIAPWIPFEPTTSNGGILGSLPLNPGLESVPVPPMHEVGHLTGTLLLPEARPIKRPGEAEIQGCGEVEIRGHHPGPPAP